MPSLPPKMKKEKKGKPKALTLERVRALGNDLLSSRGNVNNLTLLIPFLSPSSPPEFVVEAILSLQPFFVTILPEIHTYSRPVVPGQAQQSELDVSMEWLRSWFDMFIASLIEIAVSPESGEAIREVVLDAIMEFVKRGRGGNFQSAIYIKFIRALVYDTPSADMILSLFAPKFFTYIDVRYFTYTSLAKIAKSWEMRNTTENENVTNLGDYGDKNNSESRTEASIHSMYLILSQIPSLKVQDDESGYEMWSQSGLLSAAADQAQSSHRKSKKTIGKATSTTLISKKLKSKFTKAWTSFLTLPLPLNVYKEVLANVHQMVIPNIADPLMLCDFLTRSYDVGGVISVMALSGLYILMTEYGVEYPNFYTKLYALMTPDIFIAKYRVRFFQLFDTSLKSGYVSAHLAAAFAKKLSRLALFVPPSGALVIIAIIHNLLRRHPSVNSLVHKVSSSETDQDSSKEGNRPAEVVTESSADPPMLGRKDGADPFKIEESDPMKSDAMRSSLWEIDTLRHHYCPAVSRFVSSLENDLTVRKKTSEITVADFSSGSYATIFGEEVRRRIKQVPLAFYRVAPTSLFSEYDFAGWSFGGQLENQNTEGGTTHISEGVGHQDSKRQKIEC